jgi:hypothetical protein
LIITHKSGTSRNHLDLGPGRGDTRDSGPRLEDSGHGRQWTWKTCSSIQPPPPPSLQVGMACIGRPWSSWKITGMILKLSRADLGCSHCTSCLLGLVTIVLGYPYPWTKTCTYMYSDKTRGRKRRNSRRNLTLESCQLDTPRLLVGTGGPAQP